MTYSSEVLADSPLAYWRRGDATGTTAADSSGNSRTATYTSSSSPVAGLIVDADGARQDIPQSIADATWMSLTGITVECWINPDSSQTNRGLISRFAGVDWILWINTSGAIAWRAYNTGGTQVDLVGPTIVAGTTYHVIGTYVSGQARLYVNGTEVASSTALTGNLKATASSIEVGSYSGANVFDGIVDEAAIYAGELSSTRVITHYLVGVNAPAPGDVTGGRTLQMSASKVTATWTGVNNSTPVATWDVRVDGGSPTTGLTSKTFDVTGLSNTDDPLIEVRGVNANGTGPWTAMPVVIVKTPVLLDTFDRADSTTSVGTPDIGTAWTNRLGVEGINGNAMYMSTGNADAHATAPGSFDIDASLLVSSGLNASSGAGLIFRWSDTNNFMVVNVTTTQVGIFAKVAGTYVTLSLTGTLATVTTPLIRVVAKGIRVWAFRDGVLVATADDPNYTLTSRTTVGIRQASSITTARFDYIVAYDTPTAPNAAGAANIIDDQESSVLNVPGRLLRGLETSSADSGSAY